MKICKNLKKGIYWMVLIVFVDILFLKSGVSANGSDIDLRITLYTINHETEYFQGMPIRMEAYIVNDAAIRQVIMNQNAISYGKEVESKIIKVKIADITLKWNENVIFKVKRIYRSKGEIVKRDDIEDVGIFLISAESGLELIGENSIRGTWQIPFKKTKYLPLGEYEIEAIFDTSNKVTSHPDIYYCKLISNPVYINIKKPVTKTDTIKILSYKIGYGDGISVDQKIELAKEILRLDPESEEGHGYLYGLYCEKGELEKAIEELEICIKYLKEHPPKEVYKCPPPGERIRILEDELKLLKQILERKKSTK